MYVSVVMPYLPHIGMKPDMRRPVGDFSTSIPDLPHIAIKAHMGRPVVNATHMPS
jgi:hypothetical protein